MTEFIGGDATTRKALGQYDTAAWAALRFIELYFPDLTAEDCVCDAGCGPGAFLAAIPADVPAFGVEIDAQVAAVARRNTGRDVIVGDFRTVPLSFHPTTIVANPPFKLAVIDGFLDRAHALLPEGGKAGFLLPAYALQTASRVSAYADRWSIRQDMIPRNLFPGLSKPLVFAQFTKDRRRLLVGFALYRETADMQRLPNRYREILAGPPGSVWRRVVAEALRHLGGEAPLWAIYAEIEGSRPTRTEFWREQIRRTLRRDTDIFHATGRGRYRLDDACENLPLAA